MFDTEGEANTAQTSDYNEYITNLPIEKPDGNGGFTTIDNTKYITGTTSWSSPVQQRVTDGKYVYNVCPAGTATGRLLESLDAGGTWFPIDEV